MEIKVLGTGCAKCKPTCDLIQRTGQEAGNTFIIDRVEDMRQIVCFGVMITPAVVVAGTLRQALAAMRDADDLTWVLLPGNHDSLATSELWRRISGDARPTCAPLLPKHPWNSCPASVCCRRPARSAGLVAT